MAAPNEYYVRATNGNDSNDGLSHANAWKTIDHALDTSGGGITRDSGDGDRINVNDEADVVLSAALDIDGSGQYGNPTITAPLIFQGYTSTAGDGGIGGISGGGSVSIISDTVVDAVIFHDMHLHNCGSAAILDLDNDCTIFNCELNNTSGDGARFDDKLAVIDCYFHDIGGAGVGGWAGHIVNNFFKNGTKSFTKAIDHHISDNLSIVNNIVSIGGASDGISYRNDSFVSHNTVYSNGGTGDGIVSASTGTNSVWVVNNLVVGFSGTGGVGIRTPSGGVLMIYGHNKFYDNETDDVTGVIFNNLGNNTALGASPFTDPSSDDFTVDATVKAGAYPTSFKGASTNQFLDVGAAQRQEAGGGILVPAGMTGGVRG